MDKTNFIKVSQLKPQTKEDDIKAYFQKQRCGGGIVKDIIWLDDPNNTVALVEIEGLSEKGIEKLHKGKHSLGDQVITVERSGPIQSFSRVPLPKTMDTESESDTSDGEGDGDGYCSPTPNSEHEITQFVTSPNIVKVEGIQKNWDKDMLDMVFDDEDEGGGEIEEDGILIKEDVALITFKDPKVAEQVVSKRTWTVLNKTVRVAQYKRQVDPLEQLLQEYKPESTIVLKAVPVDIHPEHLTFYIEKVTTLDKDNNEFKLRHSPDGTTCLLAILDQERFESSFAALQDTERKLAAKYILKIERLKEVNGIKLVNMKDEVNEGLLKLYFKNHKKSGGGKIEDVKQTGRGQAIVIFQDPAVLQHVLEKNHSYTLGEDVEIKVYHPILSIWFDSSSFTTQDGAKLQHACFDIPLSPILCDHLVKKSLLQPLTSELASDFCAGVEVDQNSRALCVSPKPGSQWEKDWQRNCKKKVEAFLSQFDEQKVNIPKDVAGNVYPVILANVNNPNVSVTLSDNHDTISVVGLKNDVDKLDSTIRTIINKNLDTINHLHLDQVTLILVDKCLRPTLTKEFPAVLFQVEKGKLQVSGKAADVTNFSQYISSLKPPATAQVQLPPEAIQLYARQSGQNLLQSNLKFSQKPIWYCFKNDQGEYLGSDELTAISSLWLVAVEMDVASNIAQQLQNQITFLHIPVPSEFRYTIRKQCWDDTRQLEEKYVARLIPKLEEKELTIVCDQQHKNELRKSLEDFIKKECYREEIIKMQKGQWKYMCKHSKEWQKLFHKIEDSGVKYTTPSSEPEGNFKPIIHLNGETTPVTSFANDIKSIRDKITSKRKEIVRSGAVKHFLSDAGRLQLKGLESEYRAIIESATQEEVDEAKAELADMEGDDAPLHVKICSGTLPSGQKVTIIKGDILEWQTDVLVNPANERLEHSGGLARAIVEKGGDIIQEESTAYRNRHGELDIGDAVMMKQTGALKCKAIVHAVGPKWKQQSGKEEAYLAKATRETLSSSSTKYKSVTFPAISTGIFSVPVAISAKAMISGILEFYRANPTSSLDDVTIMVYQESHIKPFLDESRNHLQNLIISDFTPTPSKIKRVPPANSEALEDVLPSPASSKTQTWRRPSKPSASQSPSVPINKALKVKKGALTDHKADVYINTTSHDLVLSNGAVSASLLRAGGQSLQDECTRYVTQNGDLSSWGIATTGGGNLKCKHVIHTAGDTYSGSSSEKALKDMLIKIMKECDHLKATSVAFPALGTGNLGYPEDIVARLMIDTTSDYLNQNPSSSIRKVLLVIFMERTHQIFKTAMSTPHQSPSVKPLSSMSEDSIPTFREEDTDEFHHIDEDLPLPYAIQSEGVFFQCNNVSVNITHGDITDCTTDGLVSTSSDDLTLQNFGVMKALKRKGGSELQKECHDIVKQRGKLTSGTVLVTGPGRPGGLKCKKILHVLAPRKAAQLSKTINSVFKMAERFHLKSIALPAIGTGQHGFQIEEAADAICQSIVELSKRSSNQTVQQINIVLFQKDIFESFSSAFSKIGKSKGMLERAWNTLNTVMGFVGFGSAKEKEEVKEISIRQVTRSTCMITENTVLLITVFANEHDLQAVMEKIQDLLETYDHKEEISDERISKLSKQTVTEIKQLAMQHHVKISIDQDPLNIIKMKGDKADIAQVKLAVTNEFQRIDRREGQIRESEYLKSNIQWQWKDEDGAFQDYGTMENLTIEQAYSEDLPSVDIQTEEGPMRIDFKKMEEINLQQQTSTEVKRVDFQQEREEALMPSTWKSDPMPIDPSTGKEVVCHVVDLVPGSEEFKKVEDMFCSTVPKKQIILGMTNAFNGGMKIRRIQNPTLYSQYAARKLQMEKANPSGTQNERQLFHGCSGDVVDQINHGNFNRNYAGKNATVFGRGVYFARDASYSSRDTYSPPDANGKKHIYLARVLTGTYATGNSSFLVPPPRDPTNNTIKHDSCVDNEANPQIFVIFSDAQAYPDYHIEFS